MTTNPNLCAISRACRHLLAASSALAAACGASAHVVLEQPQAAAGTSYRAVLRVGHGCDGLPTTGLTVLVPAGVQGAKPMPKPGWTLAVRSEKLATPYPSHGKTIEQDVAEIRWTAASKDAALPDAYYDEFVIRAGLPAQPGPLWFKVVQTCDDFNGHTGRNEWTQVPAEGTSTQGLKAPAALLLVEPAGGEHAGAHH